MKRIRTVVAAGAAATLAALAALLIAIPDNWHVTSAEAHGSVSTAVRY